MPFINLYALRQRAEYKFQANEDDDTAALSEVEIQASPMHGCVSVVMFRDDEIAAPKEEYVFDFRL